MKALRPTSFFFCAFIGLLTTSPFWKKKNHHPNLEKTNQAIATLASLAEVTPKCAIGSINYHYFHIIGDGHQPNGRGLYTHYKDFRH